MKNRLLRGLGHVSRHFHRVHSRLRTIRLDFCRSERISRCQLRLQVRCRFRFGRLHRVIRKDRLEVVHKREFRMHYVEIREDRQQGQ
jgi:hypothetical protein